MALSLVIFTVGVCMFIAGLIVGLALGLMYHPF
jgi:hypothetical protein